MGTSQSSKGPKNGSDLVPPWANQTNNGSSSNVGGFRTVFGRFASSRDPNSLKKALNRYARQVSGGSKATNARLANIILAGGSLFDLLNESVIFDENNNVIVDLQDLNGISCDEAIAKIANALSENSEDSDKIQIAINEAMAEALDGVDKFDPKDITDDVLVDTMICYLSNSVFLQVTMDAGKAWNNSTTAIQLQNAENDLYEFISAVVDNFMQPQLSNNIRKFSKNDLITIQQNVIAEVWNEWEGYKE